MLRNYFFKLYIFIGLLSLGIPLNSMDLSQILDISNNILDTSGLPFVTRENRIVLPPLGQHRQAPAIQNNPDFRLSLFAQTAPAQQAQQPTANRPEQPVTAQQGSALSGEKRKRRKGKEPAETQTTSSSSSRKHHRHTIPQEPFEAHSQATDQSAQSSSSLSSTSTSSSLLSSGPSAFRPYPSNRHATQVQEPVVLYLDQITSAYLTNLRDTNPAQTNFVIACHPGSKQKFNQELIKLLAKYFPNITHLDLSHVKLSATNAAFNCLITKFKHITHLSIAGSFIDVDKFKEAALNSTLRSLSLSETGIRLEHFAQSATFTQLRELALEEPLTDQSLNALAHSSFAPQLERLHLRYFPTAAIGREDFSRLAQVLSQPGNFPNLRLLDLSSWAGISEQAVQRYLTEASFIPKLEYLNIRNTVLSHDNLSRLTTRAQRLRQLAFAVRDERALAALNNNSFGSRLEALAITGNITEIGMLCLVETCPNLRRLRIEGSTITKAAIEVLARSSLAARLEVLEIDLLNQQIYPQAIGTALAETLATYNFARLVELSIRNQNIGDEGILWLASARFAPNLRVLDLTSNNLTSQGWHHLAHPEAPTAFRQLQELYLGYNIHNTMPQANPVIALDSPTGIETLTNNPVFMQTLRRLDLTETHINEHDINELARSNFHNLRELSVQGRLLNHTIFTDSIDSWIEVLGRASFAQHLTTLAVDTLTFVTANDRDKALKQYFKHLRSLTLKNQDRVMKLD